DHEPLGRPRRESKILPVRLPFRLRVAAVDADGEIIVQVDIAGHIQRAVLVAVLLSAGPGHVDAVRLQQTAADRGPRLLAAAADAGVQPVGAERPSFGRGVAADAFAAAPGDDIDHAPDRVRAPDGALRSAQY